MCAPFVFRQHIVLSINVFVVYPSCTDRFNLVTDLDLEANVSLMLRTSAVIAFF